MTAGPYGWVHPRNFTLFKNIARTNNVQLNAPCKRWDPLHLFCVYTPYRLPLRSSFGVCYISSGRDSTHASNCYFELQLVTSYLRMVSVILRASPSIWLIFQPAIVRLPEILTFVWQISEHKLGSVLYIYVNLSTK